MLEHEKVRFWPKLQDLYILVTSGVKSSILEI